MVRIGANPNDATRALLYCAADFQTDVTPRAQWSFTTVGDSIPWSPAAPRCGLRGELKGKLAQLCIDARRGSIGWVRLSDRRLLASAASTPARLSALRLCGTFRRAHDGIFCRCWLVTHWLNVKVWLFKKDFPRKNLLQKCKLIFRFLYAAPVLCTLVRKRDF